jgi:hypothetical protein
MLMGYLYSMAIPGISMATGNIYENMGYVTLSNLDL